MSGLTSSGSKEVPVVAYRKLQRRSLGEILIDTSSITEEQLQDALDAQLHDKGESLEPKKLGEILIEKEYLTEEDMLKALAYQLDLPYYDKLPVNDIDPGLVDSIPIQFSRDNLILPVARDDFNLTVAVADPLNIYPLDDLRLILSTNVNMIVSPPSVIQNSINRVYERSSDASRKVIDELNVPEIGEDDNLEETKDLLESTDDEKPIIRLVNGLLSQAVKEKASDIHIEPYENEIMVRFRIDGALNDTMQVPKRHLGSLVSRIKILGKLNIAEKRIPQDGRIGIRVAGKEIDVRLSVLPTAHGERVVMRLLDKSEGVKRLIDMGMGDEIHDKWTELLKKKHGIVLVTGPTGSGKTTLLYASVSHINTTDVNIMTVEDPVEYRLPGVGQISVNHKVGLSFGEGLRAILRQDPDVIMIGEIRDEETAGIAVQSSLTGHLVFSTLHTNDAASTIIRLGDFNIPAFQLSSAVLGVMATRLIRVLCTSCRQAHQPTDRELALMERTREDIAGMKIFRQGAGCERCFGQGYKGRTGIYELMVIDDNMKELVLKTQDATSIRREAAKNGMRSLRESAFSKVLQGVTSLDEAIQKTQSDE
ncbi:MAG: type II secretion system ATPase GspE [Oligoflexales bacterium]